MRDKLHDKIDTREALASEAQAAVDKVRAQFVEIFERNAEDTTMSEAIGLTLEEMAKMVEYELTDVTTKAVRAGFDGAKRAK